MTVPVTHGPVAEAEHDDADERGEQQHPEDPVPNRYDTLGVHLNEISDPEGHVPVDDGRRARVVPG